MSWGTGLLLNGALHWGPGGSVGGETTKIIAFDLDKEKFYHVPCPPIQIPDDRRYGDSVGEYLCMRVSRRWRERNSTAWVMKEYNNEASWVPFISYTSSEDGEDDRLTYVCDFVPRSFMDGRYMLLQFAQAGYHLVRNWNYNLHFAQEEYHHVLKWNNNLEESDEAEKYSKKIAIYAYFRATAIAYTETLSSPFAS
ncbi:hypothetical protein Tsubulata_045122 [Turnera subulata]|uniref:F-box associated domain-containing protein n=1 Tax=Turnera subulata TaxID=218843 RepID=A0A9Q0JK53_9ROSI|nr:hypothetical protein Tsubulata_045122 [Turnera subulata]